ncbi:hypothetical protein TNCV_3914671 [Trichonephila clavipes]|nr:hypothetical protein TNCV_3914671 [Trichonephila clavipes]
MFAVCGIPLGGKWCPGNTFGPRFAVDGRQEVSAEDKGLRVYPLDPHPDAVSLYSGCTLGKGRAWFLPDDRHTTSLIGLRGEWKHARTKFFFTLMDPMLLCPVTKSSTTTQANLLSSTSSASVTSSTESQPTISAIDTAPYTSNSLSTSATFSLSTVCPILQTTTTSSNAIPPTSQDAKLTSKP